MREDEALQVEDVSALLGVGRNTVYSLAKSGELASYRVGRKLRFTRARCRALHRGVENGRLASLDGPHSCCVRICRDPFLSLCGGYSRDSSRRRSLRYFGWRHFGRHYRHAISGKGFPCSRAYLGSYLALVDLYLGRADAAVVHLFDRKSGTYNIPYVQRLAPGVPVSVVRVARRNVGLIVQAGNPKHLHSWGSLAHARCVARERRPWLGHARAARRSAVRALRRVPESGCAATIAEVASP